MKFSTTAVLLATAVESAVLPRAEGFLPFEVETFGASHQPHGSYATYVQAQRSPGNSDRF